MSNQTLDINKLEIAVFDWDNTLALSKECLICSINEILPNFGYRDWDSVKNLRDRNLSFRDNFPRIFGEKSQEAYKQYKEIYKTKIEKLITAPDKAPEVIEFLRKHNKKIMIVSNKDRELLELELPLLYDLSNFDNIVCGHEAPKDKPNPEQLIYAVKEHISHITTENVWMIGDSPMDSDCAINAGAKAIRIGKPIWGYDDNKNGNDIVFIKDFTNFYKMLGEQ